MVFDITATGFKIADGDCWQSRGGGGGGGGGVLPYIDYMGMCHWPGYGFQAFEFRTGYVNQENNVGNRVYNYIKLINRLQ